MIELILAISVVTTAAPSPNYPPEKRCDVGGDRETAACTWDQYQAWDTALNAEYKAAMARLEPERRPLLLKAQRIWVQYRDANCAIGFAHGGTVAETLGNQCLLDLTRNRTKELHELHIDETG